MNYKLVSFPICPYVQRSVIMLKYKHQAFDIDYIDLADTPQWYLDRVPTGRVPSLWVDDVVLFESGAINEFINETAEGDSMLPDDPVQRARARAWVAFADQLLMTQFRMFLASDPAGFEEQRDELIADTLKVADALSGPYFFGQSLTLTDIAFAPVFTRLRLAAPVFGMLEEKVGEDSVLLKWINRLLALDEVKDSVLPDFEDRFTRFFTAKNSYCVTQLM